MTRLERSPARGAAPRQAEEDRSQQGQRADDGIMHHELASTKEEALEVAYTKAAPRSVLTNEPRPPATLAPRAAFRNDAR
jgi:hypothetical protein